MLLWTQIRRESTALNWTLKIIIKYQHAHVVLPGRAEICVRGRLMEFIGLCVGDNEINLISLKKRDQRHRAFEAPLSLQSIHPMPCMTLVLSKQ